MKRTQWVVLVPLACDLAEDGNILGDETETRCRGVPGVLDWLKTFSLQASIVVSAGFSRKKFPNQRKSLAQMMRDFMAWTLDVGALRIHIPECLGWGTEDELKAGFKRREFLRKYYGTDRVEGSLHVVTSWYHAPRVKMIANLVFGEEVVVHKTEGSIFIALHELYKYPIQKLVIQRRMRRVQMNKLAEL